MPKFQGAIFDLDGTLLDSMGLWETIDIRFLEKRGLHVTTDYIQAVTPLGFNDAAVYTIKRFKLNETVNDIIDEWNRMAEDAYSHEVVLKPYAKEYLLHLKHQGIKLGIATALTPNLFEPVLKNNNIFDFFDTFTHVDEVKRGKGFPDIYLLAAQRLCEKPANCVVFEDILAGIKGAKLGGFQTCGVFDHYSQYEWNQIQSSADQSIIDFNTLL